MNADQFLGKRCHGCGVGQNIKKNVRGQEHPWMGTTVTYNFDYEVVGCDSCDNYIGWRKTARDLDQAIKQQLGEEEVRKLEEARDKLVAAGKLPRL